jgi:hypothetical protein
MSTYLERWSGAGSDISEVRADIIRNFRGQNNQQSENIIGNNNVDQFQDVNLNNHVVVPKSLPNAITRHFVFRIEDSMSRLAKEPRNLVCSPQTSDIFKSHSKYSPSKSIKRMPDLQGDLNQVAILGAKIVSYHSTMPTPLNITFVDGEEQREFPAFKGNYRDVKTGQRIHFSIPPKGVCGNVDKAINTTSPFIHCTYLSKYKGLISGEALRNTGIKRHEDIGTSMVSLNHPIVDVILSNSSTFQLEESQMQLAKSPQNPKTGETVDIYNIDNEIVDECIDVLEDDLKHNLPLFNINGLRMKISRPGGLADNHFDEPKGMIFEPEIAQLENIKDSDGIHNTYTQRNIPRYTEVTLALTYSFL